MDAKLKIVVPLVLVMIVALGCGTQQSAATDTTTTLSWESLKFAYELGLNDLLEKRPQLLVDVHDAMLSQSPESFAAVVSSGTLCGRSFSLVRPLPQDLLDAETAYREALMEVSSKANLLSRPEIDARAYPGILEDFVAACKEEGRLLDALLLAFDGHKLIGDQNLWQPGQPLSGE